MARALIADLKGRGLADDRAFHWVIDGAKALRKAIKDHFGKLALIQRCQIHKARGILERLPPHLRAGTSKVLRQAFKAESEEMGKKLLNNLALRLDQEADGVAGAIREGIDDMLTCVRLGLPDDLRRSLVSTNQIENLIGRVRQLCKNVRRWRDARIISTQSGTWPRFLRAIKTAVAPLCEIVETDETYVLESQKGSRAWKRSERGQSNIGAPKRKSRKRGGKASKPGLSDEQVPVLMAADRTGTTVSAILPAVNADAIETVLSPVLNKDALLVTDGTRAYPACADKLGSAMKCSTSLLANVLRRPASSDGEYRTSSYTKLYRARST